MATTTEYIRRMKAKNIEMVDATSPMRIDVTQADCKRGRRGVPMGCVIAQKLVRSCGGLEANVFNRVVHVLMPDPETKAWKSVRYSIDRATRDAILAFDKGSDFQPGVYTLKPLIRSERKAVKKKRDKKRIFRPAGRGTGGPSAKATVHVRKWSDNWN